ncbi:O-antigen ligase family protein [Sphingomonas sp. TX0543]|uniref:O-antigen ligase family protein n=2 Tax=Pseudomonadota TaxID=1224 RepID=UPI0010F50DD5|nr:O-antigen ligase family protein [Sphingomonas sp. 3P27F8]
MIVSLKVLIFIEALLIVAFALFRFALKGEARRLIGPLDMALALAIPVVGLFGRDKNVFYAFMFVIPLLSVGKPAQLVRRYLLLLPLFPTLLQNYIAGGVYLGDLSAIDAFNLGALGALVFTNRGRARPVAAIDIAVWLFFAFSLLMETRGIPLTGVLRSIFTTMLSIVPPFYLLARLVSTRRIASDGTLLFVLGAFCNAVVAIFESFRGWPLYQAFYDSLGVPMGMSATLSIRAGFLRAQGAVTNPATLGLILGLAMLAMVTLRPRFRPVAWAAIMVALAAGMIGSQSRGAWIAVLVGGALYLLYERRTLLLVGLVSASLVAGAVFVSFAPSDSRIGRLVGRSGAANWTADYRKNLLARGLQEVATHPVTGQTRAQLEVSMNDMRQGEHIIDFVNTHLTVALISGLGGLALWLIAWFTPMVIGWRLRGRASAHDAQTPVALPFAMIGACFACLTFTSTIDRMIPLVLLSMGLMSAYVRLARVGDAAGRAEQPPAFRSLVARMPREDAVPLGQSA